MLDLLRENQAALYEVCTTPARACAGVVMEVSQHLQILDPVLGDQELIKEVAVELAKLRG